MQALVGHDAGVVSRSDSESLSASEGSEILRPLNQQDCLIWYSQYEQRGLPWQDLRFGKNGRPLPMRQTAHDSDGDTSEESTVAVGESQAKSSSLKAMVRAVNAFRD